MAQCSVWIAIAFLARGTTGPLWLLATALVLPIAFVGWRNRRYALTIAVALAVAIPLSASWPLALAEYAPEHLEAWWQARSIGEYFSPLAEHRTSDALYLIKNLPWYAWPSLPLVLWTLWSRSRGFNGGLAQPAVQIPPHSPS